MQRIEILQKQLTASKLKAFDPKNTLTVTDNRSDKTLDIPIKNNFIQASSFGKFKDENNNVTRIYDPGYMNTICCTSKISYIDGEKGILEYRGYPIEQLAEKSNFLEVSFLLINGELPTQSQLQDWTNNIMKNAFTSNNVAQQMQSFRYDSHPMGQLISTMASKGVCYPAANPALAGQDIYKNKKIRNQMVYKILGQVPTLASYAYRHRIGKPFVKPNQDLGYVENFLYMLDQLNEDDYKPHPKLVKALDVLFILHAEHELNCSTSMMRHLTSSGVDVWTSIAGSSAALYGPKHGGANEAVLRMLESIGSKQNIPAFIQDVKDRKKMLMGFGHRVYKNYDPRAKIVKKIAYEVFELLGQEPLVEIALELEKIALNDEYFIKRKLYPNVDFYSGIIYKAMGFPTDIFPVLFTIPRVAGWLAHWVEFLDDSENKIVRPRQNYQGNKKRDYVEEYQRQQVDYDLESTSSGQSRRRNVK